MKDKLKAGRGITVNKDIEKVPPELGISRVQDLAL